MNTDTNNLYKNLEAAKYFGEKIENLALVPPDLNHAANLALRNREHVHISKNSGGKLSDWAKHMRQSKYKKVPAIK